jgi:biopolymer transport protein ExbD
MAGPAMTVRQPAARDAIERVRRRQRVRRARRGGGTMTVSLAPMIDMTFLFLIFFLVTTTFERAEGLLSSEMPREQGRPGVALPVSPVVIRLTSADGPEGYVLTVDRFPDAPPTIAALPGFLKQVHAISGFDRDTPVVIIAADAVQWDHVVGVWNAALRAECTRVAFGEP